MKNSKVRQAKIAYDALGRLFVLQTKFRLIAQQQMREQQILLSKARNCLYKAYRLQ
ncbi:MAG: hypothetical protein ACTSSE_19525 [Candidatus Thorarchaeota archaeon]